MKSRRLTSTPECRDYRHVQLHPAQVCSLFVCLFVTRFLLALAVLGLTSLELKAWATSAQLSSLRECVCCESACHPASVEVTGCSIVCPTLVRQALPTEPSH